MFILNTIPGKIIEKGFHPEYNRISESVFSLGNGRFGQRGNFEEKFTGDSLLGNYVGGVYYPDKTRVGWWKNGYPEYFAKVLNSCNWLPVHIRIGEEEVDLNTAKIMNFERILDMQKGILQRKYKVELNNGAIVTADWKRFTSIDNDELAAIQLKLTVTNFKGKISIASYLDADVHNEDANYDEYFWKNLQKSHQSGVSTVSMTTRKTNFTVGLAQKNSISGPEDKKINVQSIDEERSIGESYQWEHDFDEEIRFTKYVSLVSSLMHKPSKHSDVLETNIKEAEETGFDELLKGHIEKWTEKWNWSDIQIEGDQAAQQGIRFNIFQLNQTYTGEDDRLNIGPKGFTGEKYGGSTYWDTEAYCLPFYLSTADQSVARQLLMYRYKQLDRAIENAEKLGFENGAALYPMVTMNGEECHNEWEITFEEIHRNGALAYAIYNYTKYTGDRSYLEEFGMDVLVGITRFWAQRFNFSKEKNAYVMLGVTGPNEYENNVNNNWYTNYIARWCMRYTKEQLEVMGDASGAAKDRLGIDAEEIANWSEISENVYFPKDEASGLFMQQDGFLDKEYLPVADLDKKHLPLVDHWSWDRILRSCYIKQADTLQGMYFFEDEFDKETIRKHFDFYEPITVHESSLSPCVHSILAASIGRPKKAYEFYLRTARLDLDDYNHDSRDGCHTTSMAGTWMSVVQGFGGFRVKDDHISFDPYNGNLTASTSLTAGLI